MIAVGALRAVDCLLTEDVDDEDLLEGTTARVL